MFIKKSTIISGIGPRAEMQDAGLFRKFPGSNQSWCIVCDGIGGNPGGGEAANLCVKTYDYFLANSKARAMVTNVVDFIKLGLLTIFDAFYTHVERDQLHDHMGCTLALMYIENDKATFCYCGDSRIFLFRNGKVHFKSLPHNSFFDDYRAGKLSLRKAEKNKTNFITRSLSVDNAFPILEYKQIKIKSGDRILVCTDGISNILERTDFIDFATNKQLIHAANKFAKKLKKVANDNYWGWFGEFN